MTTELVLPSGRFASFRPLEWGDVVICWNDNNLLMLTALAARTMRIDGKEVPLDQIMKLPPDEMSPVIMHVSKSLGEMLKHTKGIA